MRKIFVLIFLISTCFSCKKWSKIYGINGNVIAKFTKINDSISFGIYYNNESVKEKELYIKNFMYHGEAKYFYMNGKLKQKGQFKEFKKDGWWYKYDSVEQKIIEKEYFKNGIRYTYVKLDINGRCNYYNIRPYLDSKADTLYLDKNDSIRIKFYKASEKLNNKGFSIEHYPYNFKKEKIKGYTLIYKNKPEFLRIKDIYDCYNQEGLYYIEIKSIKNKDENVCCCDSIFYEYSNKLIFIK